MNAEKDADAYAPGAGLSSSGNERRAIMRHQLRVSAAHREAIDGNSAVSSIESPSALLSQITTPEVSFGKKYTILCSRSRGSSSIGKKSSHIDSTSIFLANICSLQAKPSP